MRRTSAIISIRVWHRTMYLLCKILPRRHWRKKLICLWIGFSMVLIRLRRTSIAMLGRGRDRLVEPTRRGTISQKLIVTSSNITIMEAVPFWTLTMGALLRIKWMLEELEPKAVDTISSLWDRKFEIENSLFLYIIKYCLKWLHYF